MKMIERVAAAIRAKVTEIDRRPETGEVDPDRYAEEFAKAAIEAIRGKGPIVGIPPDLMACTWNEREHKIYEIGYQEGESNVSVDWIMALSDHLDIEADGPMSAIEKIKALTSPE